MDGETFLVIGLLIAVLGLKVWFALLVDKWAKRKGRTGRFWFLCGFLWLIPTVIVLPLLRKGRPESDIPSPPSPVFAKAGASLGKMFKRAVG